MTTSSIRTAYKSVVAAANKLVPTNLAAAIAHSMREKQKATFMHQVQHVGELATKFCQLKGREAEIARRRMAARMMTYDRMVTPAKVDEDGKDTSEWLPVVTCLIQLCPYTETHKNGGKRYWSAKYIRDRPKVAILCAREKMEVAEALMKDLVENDFESSEDLEVEKVTGVDSFMEALNGRRTKIKATTRQKGEPNRNLGSSTPYLHKGRTLAGNN